MRNHREDKEVNVELECRFVDVDKLGFLVHIRIRDLRMFSECAAGTRLEGTIRRFYEIKMKEDAYHTLLAYAGRELVAAATLCFCSVLSSNENPSRRVGQITNMWVDEASRRRGIITHMVERLMGKARRGARTVCLDPSGRALGMYERIGLSSKKGYLVYYLS